MKIYSQSCKSGQCPAEKFFQGTAIVTEFGYVIVRYNRHDFLDMVRHDTWIEGIWSGRVYSTCISGAFSRRYEITLANRFAKKAQEMIRHGVKELPF